MPRVSVVIPAFNAGPWIEAAVRSMLDQTYQDLEVIVVDDGSSDDTLARLRRLRDPRLRVEANAQNRGLIHTLNRAVGLARGEWIARMDADDVGTPTRLAEQLRVFEEDSTIEVVSSGVRNFEGELERPTRLHQPLYLPSSHDDIVATLPFYNSVSHATAIVRRSTVDRFSRIDSDGARVFYDASYPHAEDYELWSRLARGGARFRNLPRVHLLRRLHGAAVSSAQAGTQNDVSDRVRTEWRAALGLADSGELADCHQSLSKLLIDSTDSFVDRAERTLLELRVANHERALLDEAAFARACAQRWWSVGLATAQIRGPKAWTRTLRSPLLSTGDCLGTRSLRLLAKAFLRR